MIKFFRHFRKTLISENKMGKYFKYAIGEILLVVIGILIALQINNWNSNNADRKRESFLINQIHIEMQDNLEQFNMVQENIKTLTQAGLEIVSIFPLNEDKMKHDTFMSNFQDFLYCPSFDPYQGTVKSIISSGNLNLIQSDSLRKLIVTWEDVVTDYREEEQMAWSYGYTLMEWAADYFPNPRFVRPDYNKVNFRGLQARMGEKIGRYQYCIEGEDGKNLKRHIETMLRLTTQLENENNQ